MTGLLIITVLLVVVGLAAATVGTDTRDGLDWMRDQRSWPSTQPHDAGPGHRGPARAGPSRPGTVGGSA